MVRTSSSPADEPNAGASPRVPVAIRNETASMVAAVSATVTRPTGVFIHASDRDADHRALLRKRCKQKTPELLPESASPW